MNIFNDIRNFIDNKSTKIIIYDNYINIINYKKILDIDKTCINIISDKKISITGNNLNIVKMLDDELLIKGNIKDISFNE